MTAILVPIRITLAQVWLDLVAYCTMSGHTEPPTSNKKAKFQSCLPTWTTVGLRDIDCRGMMISRSHLVYIIAQHWNTTLQKPSFD